MVTSASPNELQSLNGLREEDLDAVFGGRQRHRGIQHFGKGDFGNAYFGNQQFNDNVVQTNIAIEIAVALGGNVTQVIDQSNFV
jgi:hypothetical protein